MPAELDLVKVQAAEKEARKVARDAKRKERDAMIAAGGKKPRARKSATTEGASA